MDLILWQTIRASGLVAYALLTASAAMGISIRTRAADGLVKRGWVNELHQSVSAGALAASALHAFLLLANKHVSFSIPALLVPLASGWKPLPVAAGILALYLMATLVATSALRGRIPHRAWRAIHYGGFAAWALALSHGVLAGSDSPAAPVQWMYILSASLMAFLLTFRTLSAVGFGSAGSGTRGEREKQAAGP